MLGGQPPSDGAQKSTSPAAPPGDPDATASYGQIVKSTSLIGGAQGISLVLGMVRTKAAALLIGPVGVGMLGNFVTVQGLVGAVAGLGIGQSAVRDVAQAAASGDAHAITRTVTALRRVSWLTGLAGALALALLAAPLSRWTFGSDAHAGAFALLGVTILLSNLAAGEAALIQGMRRIGDLARLNIIAAATATVASIGAYLWLGLDGLVPALVVVAAFQWLASWRFARRVPLAPLDIPWAESLGAARGMARLGLVFMWNGLLTSGVAYGVRVLLTHELGLAALGVYTAAYALSGLFVNFVLGAMGADYYPRLTAAAPDRVALNRLVNQQTEVGLLLAVPGLLATMSFAPLVVRVFYSSEFAAAAALLQWFALGCFGRILSWPLGFLILALGRDRAFFVSETTANALHLALVWGGVRLIGLEGAAVAFLLLYVAYTAIVYALGARLTGFRWEAPTRWLLLAAVPMAFVAGLVRWVGALQGALLGGALTGAAALVCLRALLRRLGPGHRIARLAARVPGAGRWLLAAA